MHGSSLKAERNRQTRAQTSVAFIRYQVASINSLVAPVHRQVLYTSCYTYRIFLYCAHTGVRVCVCVNPCECVRACSVPYNRGLIYALELWVRSHHQPPTTQNALDTLHGAKCECSHTYIREHYS